MSFVDNFSCSKRSTAYGSQGRRRRRRRRGRGGAWGGECEACALVPMRVELMTTMRGAAGPASENVVILCAREAEWSESLLVGMPRLLRFAAAAQTFSTLSKTGGNRSPARPGLQLRDLRHPGRPGTHTDPPTHTTHVRAGAMRRASVSSHPSASLARPSG